jgi:MinD-like ATPase involved in chromosome partitioning or flagellar assembly
MNVDNELRTDSLLTWFDVERRIEFCTRRQTNLPKEISRISVYPTGVELTVPSIESRVKAVAYLRECFTGAEYEEADEGMSIYLRISESKLPVVIDVDNDAVKKIRPLLPLWERLAYVSDDRSSDLLEPPILSGDVSLHCFHSFKGGVGRTTSLMAFASAYGAATGGKILLVDADLEAPGITYWLSASQRPSVSFSNLLEAIHSPPGTIEEVVEYFAREISRAAIYVDGRDVFVLPAFNSTVELLNTKISPQHLIRTPETRWVLGSIIHGVASKLGARAAFVDLRAGLSELSSPILFDPRFSRFLVTTVAEQSLAGVELTLRMIKRAKNALPDAESARKPSIVLSMLTDQLRESAAYPSARERLERAYGISTLAPEIKATENLSSDLSFFEAAFSAELMAIRSLDAAFELVRSTKLHEDAILWYKPAALPSTNLPLTVEVLNDAAKALQHAAAGRIYAESQVPQGLLTTEALRNLGRAYQLETPNAVLIGAKGSGKTFSYLQIAIAKSWDKFLHQLGLEYKGPVAPAIVPLLKSRELNDANLQTVRAQFDDVQSSFLGAGPELHLADVPDLIQQELAKASPNTSTWVTVWIELMARALKSSARTLGDLNNELLAANRSIVFLIDGIEDALQNVELDPVQRAAVEALVDIPNRIRELRQPCLGALVYVREDYAKVVKAQNFGQFQSRYEKFRLNWSPREFLQLVYWICADANIIGATKEQVDTMANAALVEALQTLWGKKLGRDDAAEAYSARWVYAALCDLKGQLQARDVVRFLALASEQAASKRLAWTDRVLPPAALRGALPMVSTLKVQEAVEEYPALREWRTALGRVSAEKKRIPFAADDLLLDPHLRQRLQDIGIVFEDSEKPEAERIYVPEIYREGLGIGSAAGARPRVQALLQRALGPLPF